MRERILAVTSLFPEDDSFAVNIHYHKKCWDKHIGNISTKKRQDHVECITKREVDAVFIDHVQRTICQLNEPRTLKNKKEYKKKNTSHLIPKILLEKNLKIK